MMISIQKWTETAEGGCCLPIDIHRMPSHNFVQVGLTVTCSSILLGGGSEKAFNECLGVSHVFPSATCPSLVKLQNGPGRMVFTSTQTNAPIAHFPD